MSTISEAQKALDKAKVGLILQQAWFLSTIAFSLKYVWDDTQPTAWTDGLTVGINPQFFLDSSPKERIFVIAHESWHVALSHLIRVGNKIPKLYNDAGDYVINQLLHEAHYTMYDWVLRDDKYKGMSTNQVYDLLQKNPPPPQPKQPGGNAPGGKNGEKGKGSGNKMEGDIRKSKAPKSEVETFIKELIVKAATRSKINGEAAGAIPGEIVRAIEELINPVLPWETILDRFLTSMVKDDYTWRRPNKRFMPDFFFPTQFSPALGPLTIAIDTSGSISKKQLQEILSEIEFIRDKFKPETLTILDCDYRIHNIHTVSPEDSILDLKFSGGGGTSFTPVINYCDENPTQALLYFTDLHASQIETAPEYPVIWLCYSKHKEAPIGETIYYN